MNKYALITGGSAGIGLAVARELALRGYGLVLVARSEEKLALARESLMRDLNKEIDILTLSLDLTREDAAQTLFDWTQQQGLIVEVLVNNAGMYFFEEAIVLEAAKTQALIQLNILTLTRLCQLFGAEMAERKLAAGRVNPVEKAEPAYILNISSYSVYMPWAGWSLYSASKAYVKNFSLALARELRSRAVVVSCAAPAGVATS
ncbi:MAG: SDR family NAD(P)-dependent oxidoreductase, partial [Bacteroidales bacterium]|nr:SDR family NAD(P)-dependent oxidoreductase [Bacteroidales bacterium]